VDTDPCPACSHEKGVLLFRSTDRLYATTGEEFTIVECDGCRLIRIDPQPDPGVLSKYYPPAYWFAPGETVAERLEEAYRRLVLADHVRFVTRALENSDESGPVLDVGCGGGLFLRLMAENGVPVIGHEISLEAARVATHINGVPALCGLLPKAALPAQSCAVVTMFHLLEHLYDPAAYLESAHQLLKPKGRLVIQVPNAYSWQALLFGKRWNGYDVPRHLYDFKQRDIENLLDACGFEPVRWKHFSLRDNPAGLATTLAPTLDPMSRRVRRLEESPGTRLARNLIYMALVIAALPFTIVEAACRAGSTIMVEARKKN
jgi:SAM-dependent methyltransferase